MPSSAVVAPSGTFLALRARLLPKDGKPPKVVDALDKRNKDSEVYNCVLLIRVSLVQIQQGEPF